MGDFTQIVPIGNLLKRAGVDYEGRNFEDLYSELCTDAEFRAVREDIDRAVFDYFSSLALPPDPTLYDHLVLSLRPKDVIATFNWDPFLIQAVRRNQIMRGESPYLLFLHGNVLAGYCRLDQVHGVRGARCSKCGKAFEASSLLYPVASKPYDDEPAISDAWRMATASLKHAFMVTIFGYSAPRSDRSAIKLLLDAWGGSEERSMEQFEIIDVRPEDELIESWARFIHTHHYEVHLSAYDSWLFNHPRRTGEAYLNQYLNAMFIEANPLPRDSSFDELWTWLKPLFDREHRVV